MNNKSKLLGLQLNNSLLTNQFQQSTIAGTLDLVTNPNPPITPCRFYDATATTELVAGEGVKLIDRGASDSIGSPIVGVRAADSDAIYGVKVYDPKTGGNTPGDTVQIVGQGGVIVMNCSAAVARGASLALVIASAGEIVTRTDEEIFGIALDKGAEDDLIRVLITARGFAELPLYELST